jgi:hypothetical protein
MDVSERGDDLNNVEESDIVDEPAFTPEKSENLSTTDIF